VLLFTVGLALATVLLFGLLPALSATNPSMVPSLQGEGASLSIGRRRHRLRDAFVVAQVAVSLLLLITAGLFLRSLNKAVNVDPGFRSTNLATVSFDLGLQGYSAERIATFNRQLRSEVAALPGVESSAMTSVLPLSGAMFGGDFLPEGAVDGSHREQSGFAGVLPGYFHTMGIPLVAGRDIADDDVAGAPMVAIINQAMAKRLWPGADPIGKRFRFAEGADEPLRTVIGVARDGKYADLTENSQSFVYLPQAQAQGFGTSMALIVHSTGDIQTLLPALVKVFGRLDPDLPLARVATYAELLRQRVDKQEAASGALGVFGMLALLLAALGLYGVTAHGVAARTREIGIRMSLGARRANVLRLFVREGVGLSLVGIAIGLALSAAVSKLLAGFLFGLTATDGLTFASGAVVLCFVAALASYLPARRAAKVDPMVALRTE
jgi:predicted permease